MGISNDLEQGKTLCEDDIREICTLLKPTALILQPEGKVFDFSYENGKVKVKIPYVDIHSILEVR